MELRVTEEVGGYFTSTVSKHLKSTAPLGIYMYLQQPSLS